MPRYALASDFVEGYSPLDLATRSMLARRANMAQFSPGTTVQALRDRQAAADRAAIKPRYRTTWADNPLRNAEELDARERIVPTFTMHPALTCSPAPHDPSLLELQGTFMDSDEYCESIEQYLAKNVNHPLVQKFGWGKHPDMGRVRAS